MNRSMSSRSSPISCCHSLSMSIQSSNVEIRAIERSYRCLECDGFLTIRENIVILVPMEGAVNSRGVTRPTSLIFTLYGDMVHRLPGSGSLWIGELVRLMAPFGVSEAAVRQSVSRMSRQGWLVARREGNRAFYA